MPNPREFAYSIIANPRAPLCDEKPTRPAGGTLGAANASKRAPDGYNWFFGAVHHTIAESLYTRLSYSLEKDFEPITIAAFVPNVVVVHPKHADTIIARVRGAAAAKRYVGPA